MLLTPRGCALLCTLVLVAHGAPEDGSVKVLDGFSDGEHQAREFFGDAEELLQQDPGQTPQQANLAAEAARTHTKKIEAQTVATDAEGKFKEATVTAQAATKQALDTADPADAEKAVTAKQSLSVAKDAHQQAQTTLSAAQEAADEALKQAQAAGAIVSLPNPPPQVPAAAAPAAQQPGVKPLPAEVQVPPPAIKPAPAPTKLDTILKERRKARLEKEFKELRKRYDENKVEHQQAAFQLTKAMAKLAKVKRKIAEAQSGMSAARKEADDLSKQIIVAHTESHEASHEVDQVKNDAKLAESFVDEATVEEEVASSLAATGGGDEDLEASQSKRDDANERLKSAKAEIVARKIGVEKAKAAVSAAEAALATKQDKLKELHRELQKADKRFADAKYEENDQEHEEIVATEDRDQAKAEEANARKALIVAHGLATAAAMKASNQANAEEAHMKALIEDPEEYAKEAQARVRDQDGISEKGELLVAPDGAISQQYISKFDAMPLPDNGRNPILEAEARASLKDDSSEKAATNAAATPGPAETTPVAQEAAIQQGLDAFP